MQVDDVSGVAILKQTTRCLMSVVMMVASDSFALFSRRSFMVKY